MAEFHDECDFKESFCIMYFVLVRSLFGIFKHQSYTVEIFTVVIVLKLSRSQNVTEF